MQQLRNNTGCCGSIHAKSIEIFLIIAFSFGIIAITINLVLTLWIFKYSYYLFIIEILLIALNVFSLIFAIILRVWRSQGLAMDQKYSCSHCMSIIILFLVIINLLGSLGEDALFYFVYAVSFTENFNNLKIFEIYEKIMNNSNENDDSKPIFSDINIYKIVPWVCINANSFIQILALIFNILLKQRIKHKSDYGISSLLLTQHLPNSSQSQRANDRNTVINLSDNKKGDKKKGKKNKKKNIYSGDENKDKKKKNKKQKSPEKEQNSNPDTDQIKIMDERKKKKKKSKKSKNKDKK